MQLSSNVRLPDHRGGYSEPMFVEHEPKWRLILTFGTLVAVVTWLVVLVAAGTHLSDLLPSLTSLGAVSLVVWGIWLLFTRVAWRWSWLQWKHWLISTPDLNGRWIGKYVSMFDNKERPMALEIHQTLLRVQCVAFGPDSVGESYVARLLSDSDEHGFKFIYFYHAKRKPTTSNPGDEHEGIAVLRVIEGAPRRLEGYYVNDRQPAPLKGDIELVWESPQLKGRLDGD